LLELITDTEITKKKTQEQQDKQFKINNNYIILYKYSYLKMSTFLGRGVNNNTINFNRNIKNT
jgi:hypothetical protein